jgi:thiol-disulfide isomerase/thioredoxin
MRGPAIGVLKVVAALALFGGQTLPAQDEGLATGTKAPAVVVPDLAGKPVDLGRYIGKKPVFLEFWATWCESCEALLPQIRSAYAEYGDRVEFIGVNVTVNQTREQVRQYIEKHKPPFRTLYDDEGTSTRAFQVPATSYVVIADRTGKIVYTGSGGSQRFDDALRQITRH